MKVSIHSLEKTLYEGEATVTTLPAEGGEISVLSGHLPLTTSLVQGVISIKESQISKKEFPILGGFAEVQKDDLVVLVD